MSPNNKYVALLKYAIHLNIDISMFPTVWAVLPILLDTQDGNLEYVKLLQEEFNRYYESRSRKLHNPISCNCAIIHVVHL